MLSFDYWKNRLGSRSDIVGRTVLVNTHPMTVIGVAQAGFRGLDWGAVPSLWIPTMMKRQATPDFDWLEDRRGRWLHVFGRLKPGVTAAQAQAGLQPWFKAMLQADTRREDWPRVTADQQSRFLASSLEILPASRGRSDLRGRLERPLLVLLAATALVLLLACLNVANLFLARGFARRRETALRLALGASRGRIVRELLVQSGLLAVAGAALGLLVAPTVIQALLSFLPLDAAGVDLSAEIDLQVFAFALAAAVVTAVLSSLAPAIRASRAQPSLTLKEESSTIGAGIGLRKVLVVGQIALALVLLIGAGLFVRTLGSLRAKGPGFGTTNQVLLRIDAARNGYSRRARRDPPAQPAHRRCGAVPRWRAWGCRSPSCSSGGSWNQPLTIESGRRVVTDGVVHCNAVSAGFFATLGVPMTAGRDFHERDARDDAGGARPGEGAPRFRSAIINESLARRYFGDRNPIGARLGIGNRPDTATDIEIVGVVRTFSYRGLRETDDQAFFPFFEGPIGGGTFWIRTRVASESAFASIRTAVHEVDSGTADRAAADGRGSAGPVARERTAPRDAGERVCRPRGAAGGRRRLRRHVVRGLSPHAGDWHPDRARRLARRGGLADPARRDVDARRWRRARAAGRVESWPPDRESALRRRRDGLADASERRASRRVCRADRQRRAGQESHRHQPDPGAAPRVIFGGLR